MGNLNKLIFGDVDSGEYGVFISGEGVFNSPRRRGESVSIPGRNGSLFFDEGVFENITVIYPAFVATGGQQEFREKMRALRSALGNTGGYHRLQDTYHPDEFRMGIFQAGVETEPTRYNTSGRFDIEFDCKPQRFLVSGEQSYMFTDDGFLENPTPFESLPIIKVAGTGSVAIGPYQFTVTGNGKVITIDSEIMEAFVPGGEPFPLTEENDEELLTELNIIIEVTGGTSGYHYPQSRNSNVSFLNSLVPKIPPGTVRIGMTSGIQGLEIIPRWWVL